MVFRDKFVYTASKRDFASTAIEEAYYNVDDRELAVVVTGGSGYVYANVPPYVWSDFISARSAGNYYATTLKTRYGPADYLGYLDDEDDFFQYFIKDDSGDDNLITLPNLIKNEDAHLYTFPSSGAVGSAPSTVNVYNNTYSLAPEEKVATRKHVLNFRVDGQSVIRTHTVQAVNLEEAIEQLREVANMLDLVFEVTSATVVFSE